MSAKDMEVDADGYTDGHWTSQGTGQRQPTPPRRLVRQADLARDLGVTSQRIDTWRTRSRTNGFPDPVLCNIGPAKVGGKRHHLLWDLGECRAWYERYISASPRARRSRR